MSDGLEDVVAADTVLSEVDGKAGHLIIRGRTLDELAGRTSFEDLVQLLFQGFFEDLPTQIGPALGAARAEVFAEVSALDTGLLDRTPIEAMRALTARLADGDDLEVALRLTAAPAVFTAAVVRSQAGEAPVAPDPTLSHAADILRMIKGRVPTQSEATALDTYLVTVSDHGLNASTFAARVIASTQSDLYGALAGAIASLKGTLHGGANEAVMAMLLEAGTEAGLETLMRTKLAARERIMGFGHRVYMHKPDPRAMLMKEALERLTKEKSELQLFKLCETGERFMKQEKGLYPNLDYYAAPVFYLLGIPIPLFTPVFLAARTAGISAHVMEQHAHNRLFRPRVLYKGPRNLHPPEKH